MASFDRRSFGGGAAATTLNGDINNSVETIVVSDGSTWPSGSAGNFFATISRGESDEEVVEIDTRSTNTLTLASGGRGKDGTSAASHLSGAPIEITSTALDFDEANKAVFELISQATAVGQIPVVDAANSYGMVQAKTSGQLLIGNGTTIASVAMSGDATIDSSGVVAIGTGVIVNADINASAAIALSKLATSAWTSWTIGVSGSGWALGNATTAAAYQRVGRHIAFWGKITWGSSSSYGSGALGISGLPVASQSTVGTPIVCEAVDADTANVYPLRAVVNAGDTTITLGPLRIVTTYLVVASVDAAVKSTVPFTWTTNDSVVFAGMYEAAS